MRELAKKNQPLTRIPVPNRLVYTVFLLFAAAGMLTATLLAHDGPGWTTDSIAKYYLGEDGDASVDDTDADDEATSDAPAGPVIELPGFDPAAGSTAARAPARIHHPRSYRQILENTHQHLFTMPVLFLVLAHLFARARFPKPVIRLGVGLAAFGLAGHIGAPWLVRYLGASWSWFMLLTLIALLSGMLLMLFGSLWGMWGPAAKKG